MRDINKPRNPDFLAGIKQLTRYLIIPLFIANTVGCATTTPDPTIDPRGRRSRPTDRMQPVDQMDVEYDGLDKDLDIDNNDDEEEDPSCDELHEGERNKKGETMCRFI